MLKMRNVVILLQIASIFIYRWYLQRYCGRCWNKIWYFKFDTLKQIDDFLKEKNEKVIRLMKDELGGNIMKEYVGLRVKTYSYLKDNNNHEDKKRQKQKKVCHKKKTLKKASI